MPQKKGKVVEIESKGQIFAYNVSVVIVSILRIFYYNLMHYLKKMSLHQRIIDKALQYIHSICQVLDTYNANGHLLVPPLFLITYGKSFLGCIYEVIETLGVYPAFVQNWKNI